MLLKIEINLYARNVGNPQDGLAAFLPKRLPTCQNGSPGKALLECRYLALYIIILAYNKIRRCTNRKGISLRISNDHQACLCGVALSFNARASCNKFSYWKSRFPASRSRLPNVAALCHLPFFTQMRLFAVDSGGTSSLLEIHFFCSWGNRPFLMERLREELIQGFCKQEEWG